MTYVFGSDHVPRKKKATMMLGEKQGGQNKWESLYAAQRVQVASEELWKNNEFLKKCMKKGERREKYQAWNL